MMRLGVDRRGSVHDADLNVLTGPHQQKGRTGRLHHVMAGLCQVGALPTLNSQQLKDDMPMLFPVAAGESEITRHLATALRK